MKITQLDQCPTQPIDMAGVAGATKQVPIGKADGAPNFSIRVFTLEPVSEGDLVLEPGLQVDDDLRHVLGSDAAVRLIPETGEAIEHVVEALARHPEAHGCALLATRCRVLHVPAGLLYDRLGLGRRLPDVVDLDADGRRPHQQSFLHGCCRRAGDGG